MTKRILALVVAATCSLCLAAASASNLKSFDPVALRDTVEATAKEFMLPGAMVLLRVPQGDVFFGYGATELGGVTPPRGDTHFRIASNTKTMTAAVITLLAQEEKLRFDDPVSKYVPGVPNGDSITISALLKMRSGLFNYTNAPELAESLDHDPARVWTTEELLAIAFKRPAIFAPGAEYDYCNTNYALLGLIAEKVEGAPLAGIFQARLFGPLGMKETSLPVSTSNIIPAPYANGYLYGTSSYALADAPYPPDLMAAARAGTLKPNDDTWQNPSYALAAGGVISTASDLGIWIRALVGGRQASRPEIRVRDRSSDVWAEQIIFSRRRDAGLQLFHGLRSGQRRNAGRLDQPDRVTRWKAAGQLHHAESARPGLRSVAASKKPVRPDA
jgi:D-alanyl-D-alanine carboxypeptidase